MSDIFFLDPLRMAAALSMTTPEQDNELLTILEQYRDDEIERSIASSQYVIRIFGMERIEAQVARMRRGEVPLPPGWKQT